MTPFPLRLLLRRKKIIVYRPPPELELPVPVPELLVPEPVEPLLPLLLPECFLLLEPLVVSMLEPEVLLLCLLELW
jgi:hypothetical protein